MTYTQLQAYKSGHRTYKRERKNHLAVILSALAVIVLLAAIHVNQIQATNQLNARHANALELEMN